MEVQGSAPPLAAEAADLIQKEASVLGVSNEKYRISVRTVQVPRSGNRPTYVFTCELAQRSKKTLNGEPRTFEQLGRFYLNHEMMA